MFVVRRIVVVGSHDDLATPREHQWRCERIFKLKVIIIVRHSQDHLLVTIGIDGGVPEVHGPDVRMRLQLVDRNWRPVGGHSDQLVILSIRRYWRYRIVGALGLGAGIVGEQFAAIREDRGHGGRRPV